MDKKVRKVNVGHTSYVVPTGFEPVYQETGEECILNGEHVEICFQLVNIFSKDGLNFSAQRDESIPVFPLLLRSRCGSFAWAIDGNKKCWYKSDTYNWWEFISTDNLIFYITGEVPENVADHQINEIRKITGWEPKWMGLAREAGWGLIDK